MTVSTSGMGVIVDIGTAVAVGETLVVNGIGVEEDIGTAVFVGDLPVSAGAHEVKISASSKTVLKFFNFMKTP